MGSKKTHQKHKDVFGSLSNSFCLLLVLHVAELIFNQWSRARVDAVYTHPPQHIYMGEAIL